MESSVNTELLRSRVDTFVLKSLCEKDGYGYDILSYIYEKTQGHYEMKQSSIYSVLKRLEKQGFIKSYLGEESKGGPRRYYSLTALGREFLDAEQKQWAYTRTLLDNLVTNTNFDLEKDTPPFKASDLRPLTKRTRPEDEEQEPIEKGNARKEEIIKAKDNIVKTEVTIDVQNEVLAAKEEIQSPIFPQRQTTEDKTRNIAAYRSLFGDIYVDKKTKQEVIQKEKEIQRPVDEQLNCHHINDLKNILKNEGYNLKPYKRDEMLGISKNEMIYSNKLFRDCTILSFLFYALSVLLVFRFKELFLYTDKAILIIGLSGLALPLIGLAKFFVAPKRRIRAIYNFKLMFSYSIMIFLFVFVTNLIISLVTPSIGLTMKDAKLYPPIIFSLTIPFSVIFYQLLYKSKLYHIKL